MWESVFEEVNVMNGVSKKLDGYFVAVILQLFVLTFLFLLNGHSQSQYLHFLMLMMTFFVVILTYVGGAVVGLIVSAVFIFGYASYLFYMNLVKGMEVELFSYLWMVAIPLLALTAGKLTTSVVHLQEKNQKLQQEYKNLVTIDKETGLGNIKSFYVNLNREISRAKRRKRPCVLLIVKLPYFKEIKSILGEEETSRLRKVIIEAITESTRTEDERYTLENDTIAIIMPDTDIAGATIVKNRIKDVVHALNMELRTEKKYVNIDTKVAFLPYNEKIANGIMFKNLVEEELQYDV